MASSFLSILIVYSFIPFSFSNAKTLSKPEAFIFPIKKDVTTNQYYTTIHIGAKSTTFNVVLDLGGRFLWFFSDDYSSAADSYRPILCDTRQCRVADGDGCVFCYGEPMPGCSNNTCSAYALNPFTGTQVYSGLSKDGLRVYSTRGDRYTVNKMVFQYSFSSLREGLSNLTDGLIGLGRTRISLPAQLASEFKIREKFLLCLPSSAGTIGTMIIGEAETYKNPFNQISKSLFKTPLIKNPVDTLGNKVVGNFTTEYFIGVESIRVGQAPLSLNKTLLSIDGETGNGGTSIRTVNAYTSLHKSIYDALINAFVKAAKAKNIKRVASVAPFGACFDSKTIKGSKTGPDVPTIDLVLQNEVYWRFYGTNSMVRVSDGVMCLAFVEAQPILVWPSTAIVVGGYQWENHLVEFDVASSELRFSSSLLLHDTSCSHFGAA